jgi:two-component system, NtrC family, sensor kinase
MATAFLTDLEPRTLRTPLRLASTMKPQDLPEPISEHEARAEFDRLRVAGVLSAGLAHEISNPLLSVIVNLSEAKRLEGVLKKNALIGEADARNWDTLHECLEDASMSADSIADLIRDFQVFLRPGASRKPELVDPFELIERAVRMAHPKIRQHARLRLSLANTPAVSAPPSWITQVALNLLLNALDALSSLDQTRNVIEVVLRAEGDNVVLEVADNGPGLAPELEEVIFEPQVTGKSAGSSLGFGLSICRSLVTELGGSISVSSVPGERTCFRVVLPAATEPVSGVRSDRNKSR